MARFLDNFFGRADDDSNEGFVDYDASSSAVTEEEADYWSGYGNSNPTGYTAPASNSKAISFKNVAEPAKLCVMKPSNSDEVMYNAVDMLREGTIILLELSKLDAETAMRVVDFLTGVAAAFEGRIKCIDDHRCYAVAPKNVDWINEIED